MARPVEPVLQAGTVAGLHSMSALQQRAAAPSGAACAHPPPAKRFGRVAAVSGSKATVLLEKQVPGEADIRVEIGSLAKIETPRSFVMAIVSGLKTRTQ